MALEITDGNITEILKENKITIVDFWAQWCGPCRMLGPIIEQLAGENTDIAIGKLNVDENPTFSSVSGIRGIPTLIFYKDGVEVERLTGVKSKAVLQYKIDELKA
jgi:thioredoxin 1